VAGPGFARVEAPQGVSALHDLPAASGGPLRAGHAQPLPPNAGLAFPYVAVPVLACRLAPGRHELACAVYASDRPGPDADAIPELPAALRAWLDARSAQGHP
jgi:hypothetical protein